MPHYAIKFILNNGKAPSRDNFKYELPVDGEPSKWYSKSKSKKSIACCKNGYHASTLEGIEEWYSMYYTIRAKCYVVEVFGKTDYDGDSKIACENMRIICEIPLKKVCYKNDIVYYYTRDNVRAIKKFCVDNNYGIVNHKMLSNMDTDRYCIWHL